MEISSHIIIISSTGTEYHNGVENGLGPDSVPQSLGVGLDRLDYTGVSNLHGSFVREGRLEQFQCSKT